MKTKFLLSAVALTATFAACNNENVPSSVENNLPAGQEIVGATLVSEGGSISLGGVESRVNANGWETSDKLALAWYNLANGITENQNKSEWTGTGSDKAIYANHLFTRSAEGKFVTNSNIYQGAHFIYFPYAYSGKPGVMTVNVNAEAQTTDYTSDVLNKALYVSAQDFISASEVDAKTGKLAKDFYITPAVNALKVNATPQTGITSNSFLKNLEIYKLDIWNQDALFNVSATINPNLIPMVVVEDGEVSEAKTYKALKERLAGAFEGDATTNLTTNIDADITLANGTSLRAFTLPTDAPATGVTPTWSEIHVYVKANGAEEGVSYNMGYFRLYVKDATHKNEKNQVALKKLQEALYDSSKAYYLGNNVNSESKLNSVVFDIDLLAADFVADYYISNLEEWNLTVALVDALNSLSTTKVKPTFNLTGSVCVTEGKTINVPAHGLTEVLTIEEGAKICFETDYTVNAALANLFSKEDKVEVLTGSTLTIENEVKFVADIHNDGIINVGYKAQLGYKDANNIAGLANVDNEHGRINVVYGSYVYAETAKNGTIAYAVDANEYAYKLNNLMSSQTGENVLGNAYVNTLVVNEGITLNLAKADGNTPASDPYINNAVSGSSVNPAYLAGTTVEVVGGNLISVAAKSEVKAVKVMPSTTVATIKDINVTDDLYVMRGASVAFDATANTLGKKATASVGTLKNEGTMNVSVSIKTNNVYNEKNSSILSVLNKEVVWYTQMYYQGGMAQGDILKMVGNYTALAADENLTAAKTISGTTDGNGHKLSLNAKPGFNGLVTGTGALTITNLTIDGANKLTTIADGNTFKSTRALYLSDVTSALINNVNVSNAGYAMNILGAAATASTNTLVVSNSVLNGWASVDNKFALVTIKNTEFGFNTYFENGTENMFNGGFRAYSKTVIEDCTFAEGYYLAIEELNSVATLTLKNCKVGDTVITKSNYKTLLNIEGEASQLVYLTIE